MNTTIKSLQKAVDLNEDKLFSLVSDLIRFKTPAPPARNTAEAQSFIASLLSKHGFEIDMWDVYQHDPNVVGLKKGYASTTHKSLIINGHIDVAEVRPDEAWSTDPFTPKMTDTAIIGRGAADMKGGLGCALFAIGLLKEAEIELPGDLIFQSVIGEEVGEAGTLQCCERGYTADFALVVDTSDLHIQGQGGVITGWITIKSNETFHDATRRDMIHAGGKLFGASAIEKMTLIIDGLNKLERHWAVTKHYPGFPPGTNTINPAVIEGGRHAAFIADECKLWITVHFYPNETYLSVANEIEAHINQIAKSDLWLRENMPTFTWGGTSMIEDRGEIFPSLEVDPHHLAINCLKKAHLSIHHQKALLDVSPSVTDGGWFSDANIPAAIYGPGDFSNAHAIDESVSKDQLINFTKTLIEFIYNWTHTKKED